MLIDSEKIKQTKEQIEVMQAFIDGKEIEFKPDLYKGTWKASTTPTWDFVNYAYRIKPQEPEFVYPIYKRLKHSTETVVEFHSINSGIYISTFEDSIYKPGDIANSMAPHTDSAWEDYTVSVDAKKIQLSIDTIELFEVIKFSDGKYFIKASLVSQNTIDSNNNLMKTGRSFLINPLTNQLLKVNNN